MMLALSPLAPVLEDTPGETLWPGPGLGEHNEEILGGLLGFSSDELRRLADDGII